MATATLQQPRHLDIVLEDNAVVSDIKKALKLLKGVASVRLVKPAVKKNGVDRAIDDIKRGRVTTWNSVDEMFDTILAE